MGSGIYQTTGLTFDCSARHHPLPVCTPYPGSPCSRSYGTPNSVSNSLREAARAAGALLPVSP